MKPFPDWLRIREAQEAPKAIINVPRILIIMRGIPGAGKSHTAQQMLSKHGGNAEGHIFSTDDQFIPETRKMRRSGNYVSPGDEKSEYKANYLRSMSLRAAHAGNLKEFKAAVDQGTTPLILDNTNTKAWEAKAYAEYADKAGYDIQIQEPTSEWWKAYRKYLTNKKDHADELDEFARILHSRQQHGASLERIKQLIDDWQHNLKVEDILGRDPTPKSKFEWIDSAHPPISFGPSNISGSGVIVVKKISAGSILGPTHRMDTNGRWELLHPLGNYNHSRDFNAVIIKNPTCKQLKVIKDLIPGDEIVVDYRGQPDLEQPEDDWFD